MNFDINNKRNSWDDNKSMMIKWYHRFWVHWKYHKRSENRDQECVKIRKKNSLIMWELIWNDLCNLLSN